MNPVPHTHHHSGIHPEDGPGHESFLPHTDILYHELRDGAREGAPPRSSFLSAIASVGSNVGGPRYSQLDPNPPSVTPDPNDRAPVHYALDQITRDEDDRHARQYPVATNFLREQEAADRERLLGEDADRVGPMTPAARYDQAQTQYLGHTLPPAELETPITAEPVAYETPHGQHPTTALPLPPDVIIPQEYEDPPFKFLPSILKPLWLGVYIFLIFLVLAGLLFSGIYSAFNLGLAQYIAIGGSRWFVFKYLPTFLGMILLLWLFQIQIAVQRVAPFMAMASTDAASRAEAPFMEVQPTGFLLPKTFYFKSKQPMIGICMILFWLQIFTIPLLPCLYNIFYYGNIATPNWRWTAVQAIVWTLFALYLLQLVALILLALSLWGKRTGLLWDPLSLAEHVALLDRSNISSDYEGSESLANKGAFRSHLGHVTSSHKLGYWSTSHNLDDVWYGICREGQQPRQYSDFGGERVNEKQDRWAPNSPRTTNGGGRQHGRHFSTDSRSKDVTNLEKGDEDYNVRTRYLPWFLKPAFALLWVVLMIILWLIFIIVSFVNNAVLYGFNPRLPVLPNAAGFASANFFYSFMPALLAQLLFLGWISVDLAYRRLQPYAALNTPATTGAHAQDSLLLDYPYRLPFFCTFTALLSGHYLVAWFSFLTLIAATFPILAGGVFWSQFYIPQQETRISVESRGYYALCVFLALAAFSAPLVLFTVKKRRLPHAVTTLAEQFSFLYASPLLGERGPDNSAGSRRTIDHHARTEMTTRLLASHTKREAEADGGRFVLGRLTRNGKAYLNIDRIGRGDRKKTYDESMIERSRYKRASQSGSTGARSPSGAQAAPGMGAYGATNERPYTPTTSTTGAIRYDPTFIPGRGSPNAFALQQQRQQQTYTTTTTSTTRPHASVIGLATSTSTVTTTHISPTSTNTSVTPSGPVTPRQNANRDQHYHQAYEAQQHEQQQQQQQQQATYQQQYPPQTYNKYNNTLPPGVSGRGLGRSHGNKMGTDERRQEGAIAEQLQFGRASGEYRGPNSPGRRSNFGGGGGEEEMLLRR